MMDDSDSMVECPYNKSHRVQKSRMQTHLFKCRKNYPNMEFKRCPFNANHDVTPAELQRHMETCPDRGTVQNHLVQTVKEKTPVIMKYEAPELPPEDENWDCDVPVQTYDPTAKNLNVKILRGIQGASKSERKHHRAQERLRFTAVAENGGCEGAVGGYVEVNSPATAALEDVIKDKMAYDYNKPIRRPTTASNTFAIPEEVVLPPKALSTTGLPETLTQSPLNMWGKAADNGLARVKSPEKSLPIVPQAWGNAAEDGRPSTQNQADQQANGAPAWVKSAGRPPSRNRAASGGDDDFVPLSAEDRSYRARVSVDMGEGIPVPNLERDFPALGRGRGRLRE